MFIHIIVSAARTGEARSRSELIGNTYVHVKNMKKNPTYCKLKNRLQKLRSSSIHACISGKSNSFKTRLIQTFTDPELILFPVHQLFPEHVRGSNSDLKLCHFQRNCSNIEETQTPM